MLNIQIKMPASAEIFQTVLNPVFVETGSYLGDGIQAALDAGFQQVISIELSDKYFDICAKRFAGNSKVRVVQGDSALCLEKVIASIQQPITFWLDGHFSAGDTAQGVFAIPLMQELAAIAKHPNLHKHTVLIDDMRCWRTFNPFHGFEEKDVVEALMKMHSNVQLEWIDTVHSAKDILIAKFA